MAGSLVTGKKKITQNDLRRIMIEEKRKISKTVKKIDSPLAKYNDSGQLLCTVCESVVRSEAIWKVHINSKKHRENFADAKRRREETVNFVCPSVPKLKRPAQTEETPPPKKLKGILKNAPQPKVPEDFFDLGNHATVEEVNRNEDTVMEDGEYPSDDDSEPPPETTKTVASSQEEVLPEGFFDDPLLDAKARNVEYKDPIEEEWEKFQKEMKEEATVSAQIIAEDQEEATAERQIDEIDEQMRNWSRVLDLVIEKEAVVKAVNRRNNAGDDDLEASSADEAEFDEYLDWRAKKSYK
ncbi:zinc finger protein 830 [Cryptotermes secundus]|uniref:zinc finger protein 830 n=1 Tax=Cryptotermes secundus TaxID=105785 RepID=UPI000CD7C843|nr:zinc finger protein 830 [Cryptotermes secundus]